MTDNEKLASIVEEFLEVSKEEYFSYAVKFANQGRYAWAEEMLIKIIRDNPDDYLAIRFLSVLTYNRLGILYHSMNRFEEAIEEYKKCIEAYPNFFLTYTNLSHTYLVTGNYEEGWKNYDQIRYIQQIKADLSGISRWQGERLRGRTILIIDALGIGDTILLSRYVKLLADTGARVVFMVRPGLRPLFEKLPGVSRLVTYKDQVPECDFYLSIVSLPGVFRTSLQNVPADIPYIFPNSELSQIFSTYAQGVNALKVGICWQGSKGIHDERSMGISHFRNLFQIPGVLFFCLKQGGRKEFLEAGYEHFVFDFGHELDEHTGTFLDTPALVDNLDLVITCDTSIVHLAGAMGRPTWLLLPYTPGIYWLLDRSDSPWYPTVRIFRQPAPGDWDSVFEEARRALAELAESRLRS